MMSSYLFTSESVSEGHPDKVADQISDAVLDAILAQDKRARVACETMVKTGVAIVAGEITTSAWVDIEALARKVIIDIGYDNSDVGFDGHTCGVLNMLGKQSPDIATGVDRKKPEEQGAGDQGLMFGYACNETPDSCRRRSTTRTAWSSSRPRCARDGKLPWLRPDAKSQVTLRYDDDKLVGLDAVVLSTQHDPGVKQKDLRRRRVRAHHQAGAAEGVARRAAEEQGPHQPDRQLRDRRPGGRLRPDRPQDHRRHLRRHGPPRRRRVLGQGSVQGRPLGRVRRALRRQEHRRRRPGRPVRSAGVATRSAWPSRPRSRSPPSAPARSRDDKIEKLIRKHFDLRPYGIIKMLDLLHPIYQATAAYGHFGRKPKEVEYVDGAGKKHKATAFSWEKTDKADELRKDGG